MLISLDIKNIALITSCKLNINNGLNILSGETGAGKSIIIDSLNFILGARADKTLIRSSETSASVEAVFDVAKDNKAHQVAESLGIDVDDTYILKRVMTKEGRNECRVNGKVVTLTMLNKITPYLADIYGQNDHHSLIDATNHINLLDNYGSLSPFIDKVAEDFNTYQDIKSKLARYGSASELKRKIDSLNFEIEEIENANIQEGEEEELKALNEKFMFAEKILSNCQESYNLLSNENMSVEDNINSASQNLSDVGQFDEELSDLGNRLDSISIELNDIVSSISNYISDFDFNEEKARYVDERLDTIKNLKRKYGHDIESFYNKAKAEYDELINADDIISELNEKLEIAYSKLEKSANELSAQRKAVALKFSKEIVSELKDLGMKSTVFEVNFDKSQSITANGFDVIEFMISPNLGEPVKPLAKILSGGEMSRFMLAFKNLSSKIDDIDTMVFDEIDTGISGKIAQVVAEKLSSISKNKQVIAITHLPQLASLADNHYLIEKSESENKTITEINLLDEINSIQEIARLIGGSGYSEYSLPHAKEMKEYGKNYKLA